MVLTRSDEGSRERPFVTYGAHDATGHTRASGWRRQHGWPYRREASNRHCQTHSPGEPFTLTSFSETTCKETFVGAQPRKVGDGRGKSRGNEDPNRAVHVGRRPWRAVQLLECATFPELMFEKFANGLDGVRISHNVRGEAPMSKVHLPSKADFDALQPTLEARTREWVTKDCSSFDEAIDSGGGGSIWDMPMIDSKRVVSLLVEFEMVIGNGCSIPVSVIEGGGYSSADELVAKLFPRIRDRCPDTKPGIAPTTSQPSKKPTAQVAR